MQQFFEGQTRSNRRTGEVQEFRNGSWVTVKAGNGPSPMMSVQTRGADPLLPAKRERATNLAAASAYEPTIKGAEATIKTADAGVAGTVAQAEAAKALADARKAEAELAKLKEEQGKVDPKSGAYAALQQQIDRVTELYKQNLQGGVPNSISQWVPDMLRPGDGAFDTASQGLTNPFMAAFRIPGAGSQSDTELKQFLSANTPDQGDSDAVIEEKIRNIQTRLNAERPDVSAGLPPVSGGNTPQVGFAQGQTRSEIDPVLRGVGQRVGAMIARGDSDEKINEFLRKSGVDPAQTNIGQALQHRKTPEFKTWQRANPGAAYPIGPEFYTREVPMTSERAMMNMVAQSGPGAFVASAGNAISGGRLDNLSSDPEMARAGMDLMRANSPLMSLGGDIAGQAALEATVNRIPGVRGLTAGRWGRRGADAIYGAYSGSGEMDSTEGGLLGAAINTAGGGLGRRLQSGVGGAMTGVTNPNLQYLNARDVPLTIGQIGRGSESILGRTIGGVEERALGLPGLDAVIGTARQRGDQGFNRAAFNEAFAPVAPRGILPTGNTGSAGVTDLAAGRNRAYSFLDGINLPIDAQFAGTNAGLRAAVPNMPAHGNVVTANLDQVDRSIQGAALPGRDWQDGVRIMREDRNLLAGQPGSRQATQALTDAEGNLMDLAVRQGPPDAGLNLQRANTFNANAETLTKALDNGPSQARGELFSPTRLDTVARDARNFGGRFSSISGNRPFYQLTQAGMNVMPNLTPDSGSIGRLAFIPVAGAAIGGVGGALGGDSPLQGGAEGGGSGLGTGVAATALLSGLYSQRGQRAIQRALLGPRPNSVFNLGNQLRNHDRISGAIGAALLRDFFLQDELGQ